MGVKNGLGCYNAYTMYFFFFLHIIVMGISELRFHLARAYGYAYTGKFSHCFQKHNLGTALDYSIKSNNIATAREIIPRGGIATWALKCFC